LFSSALLPLLNFYFFSFNCASAGVCVGLLPRCGGGFFVAHHAGALCSSARVGSQW
jgi:hypothetical protein